MVTDKQLASLKKYLYTIRVIDGMKEEDLAKELGIQFSTLRRISKEGFKRVYYLAIKSVFSRDPETAKAFNFFTDDSIEDSKKITIASEIYEACNGEFRNRIMQKKSDTAVILFERHLDALKY